MCFGGKSKEVQAPPSKPPTTFDYQNANRADSQQRQVANASAPTSASFGSELGTSTPSLGASNGA